MSLFLCLFHIFHQNALQVKQRENDTFLVIKYFRKSELNEYSSIETYIIQ